MKNWKKIFIDGKETIYSVSTEGEIRNDIRNTILTQSMEYEYAVVGISVGQGKMGKEKECIDQWPKLFIPNLENKPYVNHQRWSSIS